MTLSPSLDRRQHHDHVCVCVDGIEWMESCLALFFHTHETMDGRCACGILLVLSHVDVVQGRTQIHWNRDTAAS